MKSPTSSRKKGPSPKKGAKRQTTAMKAKDRVDPFKGVVKADILREHMKMCCVGGRDSESYIRGALKVLETKPPNPFIVPLLKKAIERGCEYRNQRTRS